jgi:cytosolic iron-sulfur protein assembly protein CIAO1
MQKIQTLASHTSRVWHLDFSPNSLFLASCGGDRVINIFSRSSSSFTLVDRLDGSHTKSVRKVRWSRSGLLLASASFDGTVIIWKQTSSAMEAVLTLEGHESEVKGVAWSVDDRYLATCGRDKTVWVWETDPDFEYDTIAVLSKHSQDVKTVEFHPTEMVLLSAGYDNTIVVWVCVSDDWVCREVLLGHESTVWDLKWDQGTILSVSDDLTMKRWRMEEDNRFHLEKTIGGVHCRAIFTVDAGGGLVASVRKK